MIVVAGAPLPPPTKGGEPGGLAAAIALEAARSGSDVELVGRVRDGAEGDAIALALARAGVGHAALLRDPASAVGSIEPADLELALRYVTSFRVLVLAAPASADLLPVATAAAQFAGAHLIAVLRPGDSVPEVLPGAATVLAAPAPDPDTAFARLVAAYAVGLDEGGDPASAWAAATVRSGAERLTG